MTDPRIAAIPDVHGHAQRRTPAFYGGTAARVFRADALPLVFTTPAPLNLHAFLMVCRPRQLFDIRESWSGCHGFAGRSSWRRRRLDRCGRTAGVDPPHAAIVSEGLRRGMRFAIGAEMETIRALRPDAQNIVDALRPDGINPLGTLVQSNNPEKGADWAWPFDSEEFIDLYER